MLAKLRHLEDVIARMPGAHVAFSGGADSAFLAEVAHRVLEDRCEAVIADSPSLPREELREAKRLAGSRGWRLAIVETDEMSDERYASNPTDRCYYCKSALFDRLEPLSRATGWEVLLGTNVDDLGDWRPGQRAASERGARHPMVEASLTKNEIRTLSAELGLETHDKPASACLSSRFAYGVRVTREGLARIEGSEAWLKSRGWRIVRVRDLGENAARVEVGEDELASLKAAWDTVEPKLKSFGFTRVLFHETGYRQGALNDGVIPIGPIGPIRPIGVPGSAGRGSG